jgi:leucyl aminopeptidase
MLSHALRALSFTCFFAIACGSGDRTEPSQWVKLDNEAATSLKINFGSDLELIRETDQISIFKAEPEIFHELPKFMHDSFGRCGGFFSFDDKQSALTAMAKEESNLSENIQPYDFQITQLDDVSKAITQVDELNIKSSIQTLSQYRNRFYQAQTGLQSQQWVHNTWADLGSETEGFSVSLFEHSSWLQPSVIATWEGSEAPDEIIVIGGHGDSISGYFDRANSRAPGADDNASGIAAITETIRSLIASGYQPKKTLKFMSYAAEEVGLKGSNEIANLFQREKKTVVAVMQLDMTNHTTTPNQIAFIRDNTNDQLSEFTKDLVSTYLPELSVIDETCGYACSDHASWTQAGYRSVFPFEAATKAMNGKIHTPEDLISYSNNSAHHASHFARLATAFMIEIAK